MVKLFKQLEQWCGQVKTENWHWARFLSRNVPTGEYHKVTEEQSPDFWRQKKDCNSHYQNVAREFGMAAKEFPFLRYPTYTLIRKNQRKIYLLFTLRLWSMELPSSSSLVSSNLFISYKKKGLLYINQIILNCSEQVSI